MPDIDLEPKNYRWVGEARRRVVRTLRPLVRHHKTFMRISVALGVYTFFGIFFFIGSPNWIGAAVGLGPAVAFAVMLIALDWMDDEVD